MKFADCQPWHIPLSVVQTLDTLFGAEFCKVQEVIDFICARFEKRQTWAKAAMAKVLKAKAGIIRSSMVLMVVTTTTILDFDAIFHQHPMEVHSQHHFRAWQMVWGT
eukprot:4554564-Karenia_brevis.AAC.1